MKLACAIAAAVVAWAQPAHYSGNPITIAGQCTAEKVQAAGLPCTADEPCALYLELASIEAVGNRLVLAGNLHTGSATLESILLISDDNGKTWTEAFQRVPSAVLDQAQFLDFEAGWINGHILQAVPRDPFLLLTTDGGKTWRRRPVFGESRSGAIDQFWFDSRSHGLLTIDRVRAAENGLRYEIWESLTGGESWSVRQVNNEPLKIPRPARETVWRIRGDAGSKINRIEKTDGSRWVTVAAFAVAAGECKPVEPDRVEAPPPAVTEAPVAQEPAAPGPRPAKPPSLKRGRKP